MAKVKAVENSQIQDQINHTSSCRCIKVVTLCNKFVTLYNKVKSLCLLTVCVHPGQF